MAKDARVRRGVWSFLAVGTAIAAVGLTGCGSDWPQVQQDGESAATSPRIVAAEVLDSGVEVTYRVPGANGGDWPVLRISVQSPDSSLGATSQSLRYVDEEGVVVVPMEINPGHELIAFGSAFYENGERIYLPEKSIDSTESMVESGDEQKSAETTEGNFVGSWEATGEMIYVPPNVNSNQPVGSIRERPWSFEEVCRARCEIVFTRGTLYGPSVTRLVKRGRFFFADFPPVKVPCSYPPGSSYPRRSSGQSHSRYKLRWSSDRTRLLAIEHRFQTGCYPTTDPPDVTRWVATRAS
jgi:hypothetical protein